MRILLLGKNGQVGWELQRSLAPLGELISCDRSEADLSNSESLRALVRKCAPDVVVNAAAYTAVDKAESEVELARRVNAESVKVLAEEVKALDGWLIHYSTDYVYDGKKAGVYVEEDATNPQSVYGQTKLDGEIAIKESGCQYLIFRTSWVFASRGNNFAKTMLRLAKERDELKVVADQIGAPTSAELIADVTALILRRLGAKQSQENIVPGTYHLVSSGETSWHGYAQFVLEEANKCGVKLKVNPTSIVPISTDEYPLPAARPINSRLNTDKLRGQFGVVLPSWQYYVKRMVVEIV